MTDKRNSTFSIIAEYLYLIFRLVYLSAKWLQYKIQGKLKL